jgi:hypothetical protein
VFYDCRLFFVDDPCVMFAVSISLIGLVIDCLL